MSLSSHIHHRNRPAAFRGRGAQVYDVVARRVIRRFYRRISEDIADAAPEGGAVLDMGTGPGVLLAEIAGRRTDLQLTGVDLSADMVSKAMRNLGEFGERVSVRTADVTDLPFADGSFDLVVSSLSVHHWDRPEAAIPELARVLRPGGRFYVYDAGFAPFDILVATARAESLFTGAPARRTSIRTGIPILRRCTRQVMYSGSIDDLQRA